MKKNTTTNSLENFSLKTTQLIGTSGSIALHSLLFIGIFILYFFGISIDKILLILTTAVSLEAIYLSIFIQLTINHNTASLKEVEKDVDEIQEDVDEIQKDVDEIQEDEQKEAEVAHHVVKTQELIGGIEMRLQQIMKELQVLKKNQ
jgi:peptidoglycan hydrolase CwlO-like protein